MRLTGGLWLFEGGTLSLPIFHFSRAGWGGEIGVMLALEGEVDANLHCPVAGVHVALAQKVISATRSRSVDGVFGISSRDTGRRGTPGEREARCRLGVGRVHVAQ